MIRTPLSQIDFAFLILYHTNVLVSLSSPSILNVVNKCFSYLQGLLISLNQLPYLFGYKTGVSPL